MEDNRVFPTHKMKNTVGLGDNNVKFARSGKFRAHIRVAAHSHSCIFDIAAFGIQVRKPAIHMGVKIIFNVKAVAIMRGMLFFVANENFRVDATWYGRVAWKMKIV